MRAPLEDLEPDNATPLTADAADVVASILRAPIAPQSAAPSAQASAEQDAAGVPFNPRLHTGHKTTKGLWRRKTRAGRAEPAATGTASPAPRRIGSPPPDAQAPLGAAPFGVGGPGDSDLAFRTTALVTVSSLTGALTMVAGPAWKASKDEHDGMVEAWTAYFKARGISDVPPEILLAMAMSGYVFKRITLEQVMAAGGQLTRRFRRSPLPGPATPLRVVPRDEDIAPTGFGSDGDGEVHAAQAPSAGVPAPGGLRGGLHDYPG